MHEGNGFVLVYSITSRVSFEEIVQFRDQVLRAKEGEKVPMVLLGNKCDLENDREVSKSEGEDLAKSFGCTFFETSAQANVNIENGFQSVLRQYLAGRVVVVEKTKPGCVFL